MSELSDVDRPATANDHNKPSGISTNQRSPSLTECFQNDANLNRLNNIRNSPKSTLSRHIPLPLPVLSPRQMDLFWRHVDIKGAAECWLWTGSTSGKKGSTLRYATWNYRADGIHRNLRPHRVAYFLTFGAIPEGMTIDHLADICTSTLCMNPAHMEAVSLEENIRRRRGDTRPMRYRHPALAELSR